MTLEEYEKQALMTVIKTDSEFRDLLHWVLGINGEAGEIAEKVKKSFVIKCRSFEEDKHELAKEVGDVLLVFSSFCPPPWRSAFETIAQQN